MGSPTAAPRAPMRRTTDDRVVAGVCGGLAERWSVDTVAVRVTFVLGAMLWGLSIPLYVVLWRRWPEVDSPTRNPVRPGRLPSLSIAFGAIALMAAFMVLLRSMGLLPPEELVLPASLASLGVVFLWAGQPLRPVVRPAIGTGRAAPPPPPRARPTSRPADGPERPPARPVARSAPFGSVLVGATMLAACVGFLVDRAGWVDVQWRVLGALLLVVVGVVLVGGATLGRPPGLLGAGSWLMVLLLLATVFRVPLGSGVGARDLRPVEAVGAATHLFGGSLEVDAVDLLLDDPDGPEILDVSVAVGDLSVVVPRGVEVSVEARAGLGSVTVFAEAISGVSAERSFTSSGFDGSSGQLIVRAAVGLGRVIVEQER
jgi:phage shock protein PspC (stress-responsive transcriptional regulator)